MDSQQIPQHGLLDGQGLALKMPKEADRICNSLFQSGTTRIQPLCHIEKNSAEALLKDESQLEAQRLKPDPSLRLHDNSSNCSALKQNEERTGSTPGRSPAWPQIPQH